MTLQQQSSILREKLARLKSVGADGQLIASWQLLIRDLPIHVDRLDRLVVVLCRLRAGGLLRAGRSIVPSGVDALLQKTLPDLRDKLVNKPDRVMQHNRWAKVDDGLKAVANALEKSLEEIWKAHFKTIAPKPDDLSPFFQGGRFGNEIGKIERLHNELDVLAQSLPADDVVLQQAVKKASEIQTLVKALDFGDIPPEVKKFIGQVGSPGGVSLGELNDKVLSWLREKNLLQAFRVNMGGR